METRLNEIHNYLLSIGGKEEDLKEMDQTSVGLSIEIMEYAHRGQTRVNGDDYASHPASLLHRYREWVGIIPNDYHSIDIDLMYKFGIPFEGVQELCLLHDVIEDTDFTLDEIRDIFVECNLGTFFDVHVKAPLELITHNKEEDYEVYIKKLMDCPNAAMVKLIDMQDNSNLLTLDVLDRHSYERTKGYLRFCLKINGRYLFIEKVDEYRKAMRRKRG